MVTADAGPAELHAALQRALVRHKQEQWNLDRQRGIIERQRRWVELFDAITDYIFVIDEERRFVRVNHAFATSVGMHPRDLIGKSCGEVLGADFTGECAFEAVREELTPYTYEKQSGEDLFQISVFPLHEGERLMTIHVMKNVTETRRLKDQLYHADKLASLGLLVSGVAHEINNPLTGAIAYTELLRMKVKDEGVLAELKKVLDSAERCKKIVDNLLTFSRQRTPSKSLESMNDIIERAIDLRGYWLKSSNIEVVRDFDEQTTVFVDSQQIQQVVLNLLLNAEQSITDARRKKGRITFTTRSDRQARTVMVQVADNGGGIPAAALPRIFDPFYTTKPVGVGTGLGLSISHGIITEHGGAIEALSPAGGGALFTITLPTGADSPARGAEADLRRKG